MCNISSQNYKNKKIINKIDIIFLNKAELIKLTNIYSIEKELKRF